MRNLKLEELFIGAWVQVYMSIPDRFSPPMQVSGIFKDGDLYLDIDGNEGDPYEAVIDETFPVAIDEDILVRFGFVRTKGDNVWMRKTSDFRLTIALRWRHGRQVVRRAAISGRVNCWNEDIVYVHELQRWWMDKVLLPFNVALELKYVCDE